MMLSQVTNFFKQNKKIMYYLGFFAVIYFALGDSVFAQIQAVGGKENEEMTFIETLNYAFKFLSILIGLLTNFIGLFLNPSWTNGTVLGLQTHLKDLWILVSNVVYFIFAILLVVIAFMNILGRGDKWELKQALPKFIIGVLIVPFSWFFVQIIISMSSILTATILSLPNDTLDKGTLKTIDICSHLYIGDAKDDVTQACLAETPADKILQGNNVFGMLSIYTYGVFAIDSTTVLFAKDTAGTVKTIADLGFKSVFNLLFVLIYGILVISLGLALFVRGVWLWLYTIFSPVFGLLYFFGKEKDGIGGKFSITEFLSLALVPVYVAGALSFGLLFIFVAGEGLGKTSNSPDQGALIFKVTPQDSGSEAISNYNSEGSNTKKIKTASGTTVVTLMNTFEVEMGGSLVNSGDDVKKIGSALKGFKGALGTLIMQLFGLAVLWISVMAALASNKITEQVVKPIAEFGSKVGQLAMKAPQYTPIFGGQSVASMTRVGQLGVQHYENKPQENAQKFVKENGLFGASESAKLAEAITSVKASMGDKASDAKAMKTVVNSIQDANTLVNSQEFIEMFASAMKRAGVSGYDKLKVGNTASFVEAMNKYEGYLDKSNYENMFSRDANAMEFNGIADISKELTKGSSGNEEKSVKGDYKTGIIDNEVYNKLYNDKTKNIVINPTNDYEFIIDRENTTDDNVVFYEKTDDGATMHKLSTKKLSSLTDFNNFTSTDQEEWKSFIKNSITGDFNEKVKILKNILEQSGSKNPQVIAEQIVESTGIINPKKQQAKTEENNPEETK